MSDKLHVVDVSMSHNIQFDLEGDKVSFNEDDQDVHVHNIKVKPGLPIRKFTGKAHYPNNIESILLNAVSLLNADIYNLSPTQIDDEENAVVAAKNKLPTNATNATNATKPIETSKVKPTQDVFGEPDDSTQDIFGEPDNEDGIDISDDEDGIHESNNFNELSLNESNINNSKLSFMITSTKLNFSKVIQIGKKETNFRIQVVPDDIKGFVNYITSKKIKIFINGVELAPKDEIDFLTEIFPYIDIDLEM